MPQRALDRTKKFPVHHFRIFGKANAAALGGNQGRAMKLRIAVLGLLVIFCASVFADERPAAPRDPKPIVSYQADSERSAVETPTLRLAYRAGLLVNLSAQYRFGGKEQKETAPFIVLRLTHTSNQGRWAEDEVFHVRYGDNKKEYSASVDHLDASEGYVIQMTRIQIPASEFSAMTKTQTLHFQIGGYSDSLTGPYLQPFRELAAHNDRAGQ